MAHEIESMMFVGATPWHGLGTKLLSAPTTREAIVAAGLDWQVETRPLYTREGEIVTHQAATRVSDERVLGVVGPHWTPLQNSEAFAFFDPFLSTGDACLETAGSLRDGERVWVLASLNRDPSVIVRGSDDTVKKYVLLSNAHDGKRAVRVGFTPIRVVCANTLAMAHADRASSLLRVTHHKTVAVTLDQVRDAMNIANASFEATAEQYRRLAARQVNENDLKKYVRRVFSPNAREPQSTGMVLASAPIYDAEFIEGEPENKRIYPKIQNFFENGRGNALPGVRGTLWAAYNAVTEYVAHERGNDAATRLDAAWFGSGYAINQRALDVGLKMLAA